MNESTFGQITVVKVDAEKGNKKVLKMIGAVEDDEFDIQSGLKAGWAITFCVLYIIVMIISILCYFVTVRAVALEIRAHNTTYLLVLLLFFAAIIEFGVIVGGSLYIPFELRVLTNYLQS